jgi:hypothetical protein
MPGLFGGEGTMVGSPVWAPNMLWLRIGSYEAEETLQQALPFMQNIYEVCCRVLPQSEIGWFLSLILAINNT